jgi:uncharacterized protein
MRSIGWLSLAVALALPSGVRAEPLSGRWEGAIRVAGQELGIAVTMRTTEKGPEATIDIPQQGAKGQPLRNVAIESDKVHLELPAGPGVAIFDGVLKNGVIAGTFRQAAIEGTFTLQPSAAEAPLPYRSEDVTVASGAATLACTLTLPPAAGRHPAVLLLTGSGAQNRDEEIFGFRPFRLIADRLTRAGVAVLRCDDRGVGGSTPPSATATSADTAEDALAAVRYLRARTEIAPGRVGVLGHSSGGSEATLVAARDKGLAYLVLLAAPAVTGEAIVTAQVEALARLAGQSGAALAATIASQQRAFRVARTGEGEAELLAELRRVTLDHLSALPEAQRRAMGSVDQVAEKSALQQVAVLRSPWYRFMLDYDPAADLAALTCPVLAIYGEKDMQVDAAANRRAFEDAVRPRGHRQQRAVVLPGANHLFQTGAKTGSPEEYATLPKEFAPGVLDAVERFIVDVTRR